MSLLDEIKFSIMDPGAATGLKGLDIGDSVENKTLQLSSKREIDIYSVLNNGPLILIFIRGTWCPFCRTHMQRLSKWLEANKNKGTCIVVSSEPIDKINEWLKENPITYLFASDQWLELSNYFGVVIAPNNFSQAATYLIDTDKKIKMVYRGKRTNKNFKELEKGFGA